MSGACTGGIKPAKHWQRDRGQSEVMNRRPPSSIQWSAASVHVNRLFPLVFVFLFGSMSSPQRSEGTDGEGSFGVGTSSPTDADGRPGEASSLAIQVVHLEDLQDTVDVLVQRALESAAPPPSAVPGKSG